MTRVARHIDTARLSLRLPGAGDLPAYTAYCASARSRFVRGPFPAEKAFEKLAAMIGQWDLLGFGRYVIHHDEQPIGHVGPMAFGPSDPPDMTWTLWQDAAEGHGFATEAAQAVCQHLLGACGWNEMLIRVQPDNTRSMRIAERLGARRTDAPAPDWYPGCITFRLERTGTQAGIGGAA